MSNWYIALDLETGGIGLPCSLLTGYFAIVNPNLMVAAECSLTIKPDDGIYHVQAKGMEVNGIDIVKHDATAMPLKEASTWLYNFLNSAYSEFLKSNKQKFIPLGHGVRQDIEFMIASKLISRGTWEQFVSHRSLDTSSSARFLQACGLLPSDLSGSLVSLADYFGVVREGAAHDARVDTLASIEVLRHLMEVVKK